MANMTYQIMPELSADEYSDLKSDIAARGVMVPIEYDEFGNVLDGHHRLKVCGELGIKDYPKVVRAGLTEEGKRLHARKLNLARRHLTQEQKRGLVREQLLDTPERSDRQIAAGLGVSNSTVSVMRKSMEERGDVCESHTSIDTLGREQPRMRKPVSVFNPRPTEERALQRPEIVSKLEQGVPNVAAAMRETRREEIKVSAPPVLDGVYDVIYADPPWRYDFVVDTSDAIENQYPTMELDEIKSLAVPSADNAVLFLWATAPKLTEALEVMSAWGFVYKTCAVWDKEKIGMGYWFRGQHELLLVGVKGKVSPPIPEMREASVYREARGAHSSKPDYYYALIEKMCPNRHYLEMFARQRHNNKWTVWGNQARE